MHFLVEFVSRGLPSVVYISYVVWGLSHWRGVYPELRVAAGRSLDTKDITIVFESTGEERADAISHMIALVNATKGDPAMAQIVDGSEPTLFLLIVKTLITFKGGKTTRYKRSIMEKGVVDDTFDDTKTALFRIQGASPHNMQAIQVDLAAISLNSSYCYILKTERFTFTWIGNLSKSGDLGYVDRMLEFINPTWQPVMVREGSEPDIFWTALEGKVEYSRDKEIKGYVDSPQLFVCTASEDNFKVKEIYNFSQDDLTTEDVLILNCHHEICVWIGRNSHIDKKRALDFGLKFLEMETPDGVHPQKTPVYVVNEGCEPPFFTRFFDWDFSRANVSLVSSCMLITFAFSFLCLDCFNNFNSLEKSMPAKRKAIAVQNGKTATGRWVEQEPPTNLEEGESHNEALSRTSHILPILEGHEGASAPAPLPPIPPSGASGQQMTEAT
ncbi:villin-1-like [Lycium ferocissimum]|uniref:villin-1-like n=1 Tax=Lycium ferocissimum TaxID=112874 RepID=UPI002814C312|nr:villin-1-like [Lycium ferocissimum]